jgi:hypothetical protein
MRRRRTTAGSTRGDVQERKKVGHVSVSRGTTVIRRAQRASRIALTFQQQTGITQSRLQDGARSTESASKKRLQVRARISDEMVPSLSSHPCCKR